MSSLGSQWKVIRHYLSITNLGPEVEKLVQKMKPATAEQWDSKCLPLSFYIRENILIHLVPILNDTILFV